MKLIYFFISVFLLFLILALTSCFSITWRETLSDECNVAINIIKMYATSQDKSGNVVIVEKCMRSIAVDKCKKEVWGWPVKPVDYEDIIKYKQYLECKDDYK